MLHRREAGLSDVSLAAGTLFLTLALSACGGGGGGDGSGGTGSPASNRAPVADAGGDRFDLPVGAPAIIDGTGSTDPDGDELSYRWAQLSGPTVRLAGTTNSRLTVTIPSSPIRAVMQLTVNDGQYSAQDTVTIGAGNTLPAFSYGPRIGPVAATSRSTLIADYAVVDAEDDQVIASHRWSVSGAELPERDDLDLPPEFFTTSDVIALTVTLRDAVSGESISETVEMPAPDAPPELAIDLPSVLPYGDSLNVLMDVTDPDGDPVDARYVLSGPEGMIVDEQSRVRWTPREPMFGPELAVHFILAAVANGKETTRRSRITLVDPERGDPIVRAGIVTPRENYGLATGDVDGDGRLEILFTDNDERVSTLEFESGEYVQDWMLGVDLNLDEPVSSVAALDLDGDDTPEIVIASGEHVFVLDGTTGAVTHRLSTECERPAVMRLADIDANGAAELVILGEYGALCVLDALSGEPQWAVNAGRSSRNMAIGQLDGDGALEIAVNGGLVFDGLTRAIQWDRQGEFFGRHLDVGDVDGDGRDEIVGADRRDTIVVYDAVAQNELWSASQVNSLSVMVEDLDGDGRAEILAGGDGLLADLVAFSLDVAADALVENWRVDAAGDGVQAVAVGDTDQDGDLEVMMTSGRYAHENVMTVIAPGPTAQIEWRNEPAYMNGPYVGALQVVSNALDPRVAFIAGDGNRRRVIMLEPGTGRARFSAPFTARDFWLDTIEYDGDPAQEFLGWTDRQPVVLDFDTGAETPLLQTAPPGFGTSSMARGDLDGDGRPEYALSNAYSVWVFDPDDVSVVEASVTGEFPFYHDMDIGDIDGDGVPEILISNVNDVTVLEQSGSGLAYVERFRRSIPDGASDLLLTRQGGSGTSRIFAVSTDYRSLLELDAEMNTVRKFPFFGISSVSTAGLLSSDRNLLVGLSLDKDAADGNQLALVDMESGFVIWRSPAFIGEAAKNQLRYVDTDNDGKSELAFGTDNAMYLTH